MEKDDELKGDGNSYDFGARMYDPRIGRWFKRDPLEGRYPHLSPYNYVANNPMIYVDPDGKKIIIYYRDTPDGKEKQFEYKPGIKPPNNKFVQNTVKMLDRLLEREAFKNIEIEGSTKPSDRLRDIIKSDKILHMIEISDEKENSSAYYYKDYIPGTRNVEKKEYGEYEDESKGYGTIKVNDDYGIEFEIDGKTYENSPTSQLGHEVVHVIHEDECPVETQARRDTKETVPHTGNAEEQLTTKESNQVNKKLGEPNRKDYSGNSKKMSPTGSENKTKSKNKPIKG